MHKAFSPAKSRIPIYYVENLTTTIDSGGNKTVTSHDSLTFVEKYNKLGNAINRRYFNKDGESDYRIVYSYDGNNNLIQELYYQNNKLESTRNHRYDKHNLLIETYVLWSKADAQLILYAYKKFDKNQNWIKRIESFETKGHIFKGPITERTIIYYP